MHFFVLIMFMSTDLSSQSGTGAVTTEFVGYDLCMSAGKALAERAATNREHVLVWGCYDTGKEVTRFQNNF